jgi:hypothetical protein
VKVRKRFFFEKKPGRPQSEKLSVLGGVGAFGAKARGKWKFFCFFFFKKSSACLLNFARYVLSAIALAVSSTPSIFHTYQERTSHHGA